MIFEKIIAHDGNATLKVNNILLYSKYRPLVEVDKFIANEFDNNAAGYLLIGLGLGYHLHSLMERAGESKPILVYPLDDKEIELHRTSELYEELPDNVVITTDLKKVAIHREYQLIIPHVWLQVMHKTHPLYNLLMDIKAKQMSYKRFSPMMEINFNENFKQRFLGLQIYKENLKKNEVSCLISSGPSLNTTKKWLKTCKDKAYILCVGSALKVMLEEGIVPDGVIISDCQPTIFEQLDSSGYTGDLFFLSTADFNTVKSHDGNKYLLLQEGYDLAEQCAKESGYPLLETGGSVATTGFSLLEYLGFKSIVLFGQDLGFANKYTHANNSTSGREVIVDENFIGIESNSGKFINTLPNLNSYLMWFNRKCNVSESNIYNTAEEGAKIEGVPLLIEQQVYELIKNS